jgi:uncharacterized protein involved in copper resistance
MVQLNRLKIAAIGMVTFTSVLAVAVDNAFAQQSTEKPPAQTDQKTEQTSGCACCKKMMENMMKDRNSTMPGMNHSTSPAK